MRAMRLAAAMLILAACHGPANGASSRVMHEGFGRRDGPLPRGWVAAGGVWRVEGEALAVDSMTGESYVMFGEEAWRDYDLEATVTFVAVREPSRWVALVFRGARDGSAPWSQFAVRQATNGQSGLEFAVRTKDGGWDVRVRASAAAPTRRGSPVRLGVRVRGTRVGLFYAGSRVIDTPFCVERASGCAGFGVSGARVTIDDVVVRVMNEKTTGSAPDEDIPSSTVVAHRGFSAVAPENTLVALKMAVAAGAPACEFDVRRCADGSIVLMHDKKVDRTTDGTGEVARLDLATIQKLDAGTAKSPEFAGEGVPTLAEALACLKNLGASAVVEIKDRDMGADVARAIAQAGMARAATVISFEAKDLQEVRAALPDVPTALLAGKAASANALVTAARKCGASIVDVDYRILSPEFVRDARAAGIEVWAWTVNEPSMMRALAAWGVTAVTTDNPYRGASAFAER